MSLAPLPEDAAQRAANRETAERARAAKAERRKTKDRRIRHRLEAQKAGLDPSDVVDTDEEDCDGESIDHSADDANVIEAPSPDVGAGSSSGPAGTSGGQVLDPSAVGPDTGVSPPPQRREAIDKAPTPDAVPTPDAMRRAASPPLRTQRREAVNSGPVSIEADHREKHKAASGGEASAGRATKSRFPQTVSVGGQRSLTLHPCKSVRLGGRPTDLASSARGSPRGPLEQGPRSASNAAPEEPTGEAQVLEKAKSPGVVPPGGSVSGGSAGEAVLPGTDALSQSVQEGHLLLTPRPFLLGPPIR